MTRIGKRSLVVLIGWSILGLWGAATFLAAGRARDMAPTDSDIQPAFRFDEVAHGVYAAIGTGKINVICNSAVIIGDDGVLVVDSGASPRGAAALLRELEILTSKPVRYLVNTHFHFDHTFGNQAFPNDTTIIAHEYTREKLAGDPVHEPSFTSYISVLLARIDGFHQQLVEQPAKLAEIMPQLTALEEYRSDLRQLKPRPPTLGVHDQLTVHLGSRTVEILHFGRGHTAGDVVVYLPKERVVATGDFYNGYIGNMSDAYPEEWAASLGELAKLDFDTIIPGHGQPFHDKAKIAQVQACMRDIWRQGSEMHARGVPAEAAAKQIDMSKYAETFPQFKTDGLPPVALTRIYDVLDGKAR